MKKTILIASVALAAVAIVVLVRIHDDSEGIEPEARPVATVEVAALKVSPISRTIPAFGVIEGAPGAAHSSSLGYDCVVAEVDASVGDRVAAGAPVMRVGPTADARMQLDAARNAALAAEKVLAQTRGRYELRLANRQDLIAAEQADADARIRLESLSARGLGGDGLIRAPQAGVVTKLDWQAGSTVPAGTPLDSITDAGRLVAHLTVEAEDSGMVKPGQAVSLESANRDSAPPVQAAVTSVGAGVDPSSGAVDVRAALQPGGSWLVGEHIRGTIEVQTKTALVAPRGAVLPEADGQVLYTVEGDKAVRHVVTLGIASGDLVEVVSRDLKPGERAVWRGNHELEDGMSVHVVPGPAAGNANDGEGEAGR